MSFCHSSISSKSLNSFDIHAHILTSSGNIVHIDQDIKQELSSTKVKSVFFSSIISQ